MIRAYTIHESESVLSNRVDRQTVRKTAYVLLLVTSLLLCGRPVVARAQATGMPPTPVFVTTVPLAEPSACEERFVAHELPHLTTTADGVVRMYQANGAGVALNDLDGDGRIDLVLGSETGPNSVFWNRGNLHFDQQTLGEGPTRAVTIVDVDADGYRDIVLTTNRGALHYWHNRGDRRFDRRVLPGVARPAYVIGWADLDADGDLDLVTASYDAGFLTDRGSEYLLGSEAGVYLYENRAGRFVPTRLATEAQALALALTDFSGDGRPDILVGNDFGVPDYLLVKNDAGHEDDRNGVEGEDGGLLAGWAEEARFAATAYSTMSFATGDVDNNGLPELFASDMKPYGNTPDLMAAYAPLMAGMADVEQVDGDPQIMENVLQFHAPGGFVNRAGQWNVDGSGWSWSAQFGDLDSDGLLDLYVVNGMIEATIFAHLPDHELVEENQAYRNTGGAFEPAPDWALNATASGRAMAMADLDDDGDLDIVVNNLRSPAVLYENRLCGGRSLQVQLAQPAVQNRDAVGARVALVFDGGVLTRDVHATSGYLSGESPVLHFGLPQDAELGQLEILWPDGRISYLDHLRAGTRVHVERR